jgi:serine/threonine-protein kinase
MSLSPGTMLGSYRILEPIGRGGMAVVYRAYQPGLDRYVAVKVVLPGLGEEPGFAERFAQEATVVAGLRHPHILTVYDYGDEQGVIYLVTEYVDGGTVADRTGAPLPVSETVRLLAPVAAALDYAHAQGILHRDVKPANILLWRDGTPVLSDFGLAKVLQSSQRLTATGMLPGTPAYMAPEQAEGRQVGPATDQYALAVVAFEMLTGRVPFTADTPPAVLLAHMVKPLPLPRAVNPALSPGTERALLQGLAKRSEDRFPSATEFIHAFQLAPEGPRREAMRLRRPVGPTPVALLPARGRDVTEPAMPAIATVAAPGSWQSPRSPEGEGWGARRRPNPWWRVAASGAALVALLALFVLADRALLQHRVLASATSPTLTVTSSQPDQRTATPLTAAIPLSAATALPTAGPPPTATALPLPSPSPTPLPTATPTTEEAWAATLPLLDPIWGTNWPATIDVVSQFLRAHPGFVPAQEKLYAARLAYGDQLLRGAQRRDALAQYQAAEQVLPTRGEAAAAIAAAAPTATPTPLPAGPTMTPSPMPAEPPAVAPAPATVAPRPAPAPVAVATRTQPITPPLIPTATTPPRAPLPTQQPKPPPGPQPGFTPSF